MRIRQFLVAVVAAAAFQTVSSDSFGQPTGVFSQTVEDGDTVRPLTAQELAQLKDPLARLILAVNPGTIELSDIENLIQPDPSMRRTFVVDEEIKDFSQPQSRRAVIDFLGSNGGINLATENVMLSVFFNSSGFPPITEVEALAWDQENGDFNYYKLDGSGGSGMSWKFRGSSRNVDELSPDDRRDSCFGCHINGAPIMKELLFPWNNWHSFKSEATYLTPLSSPQERWPVVADPHMNTLSGGDALELAIISRIKRFNDRRFGRLARNVGSGEFFVADARRLLRPLFETTEINLASAQQRSGMHPLSNLNLPGPSQEVRLPNSFFLNAGVIGGGGGLNGLGITAATKFTEIAVVTANEYRDLIVNSGLRIRRNGGSSLPGDTDFAWLTPEASFIDSQWVDLLVERGAITKAFAAAVMAIDLEQPILSQSRASLLGFVPEDYRFGANPQHPDALTEAVVQSIINAAPPTGSPEAELAALLASSDPVAVLRQRAEAYRDRVANDLEPGSATRSTKLGELLELLNQRRTKAREETAPSGSVGNVIEFPALFPRL